MSDSESESRDWNIFDEVAHVIGAPQGGRVLTRMPADNRNYYATLPGRWVTATGAGYFFAPGTQALKAILTQ